MRTYLYEISEERSISGERLLVFVAEFLAEIGFVYVLNEAAEELEVISLRPGWI